MPHIGLIIAVIAAILIVVGRLNRNNGIALAGFGLLVAAGVVYLLVRG